MDWIGRGGGAGGRNDYVTNNAQTNELRKTRQTAGSKPNGTTNRENSRKKREDATNAKEESTHQFNINIINAMDSRAVRTTKSQVDTEQQPDYHGSLAVAVLQQSRTDNIPVGLRLLLL